MSTELHKNHKNHKNDKNALPPAPNLQGRALYDRAALEARMIDWNSHGAGGFALRRTLVPAHLGQNPTGLECIDWTLVSNQRRSSLYAPSTSAKS